MFAALKFLLILGALVKCSYGQGGAPIGGGITAVPYAYRPGGFFGGGGFILGFLPLILLLYLFFKRQLEEKLEAACDALFEDVEIATTKTSAIETCEECAKEHKDEEECEQDPNCEYSEEDKSCFASGDFTASATCCSYIFTGAIAEECQTCTGFTTQATCIADTECGWVEATNRCFGEV